MEYSTADFLRLIGALGLFLYGMKIMSDALMKLAGGRMRTILASVTSNRLLAVFTGFTITAVIQSSSATTLMVVSFANASLLSLTESIAVIMGANIGTTVTAWLIALLGFKVNMASISLPLIGLGFVLSLNKKKKVSQWGFFIIGFSLLFIGLQYLKDSVPDLNSNPEVLAFLHSYTSQGYLSIILFMIIGTILTVVIQSSSATMAITIIMCFEGWIPFEMAAAMVLGENIGTTITANMAALVANYQAKRTARAHLIFNLTGVVWMMLLFYPFLGLINVLVTMIEGMSPFEQTIVVPIALSLFHTLFNILNTAVLINFVGQISRVVTKLIPAEEEPALSIEQPHYLSRENIKYPETAMKALLDESLRLYEHTAFKVVTHGLHIHRTVFESEQKIKKMLRSVERIDLDVDQIYYEKVKTIYSEIVEYATDMQTSLDFDEESIKQIRDILRADRLVVDMIKHIKPLHENLYIYLNSDNEAIRSEYNRLRKLILKILKLSRKLMTANKIKEKHNERFESLTRTIETYDMLLNGTVEKLIRNHQIPNSMATSLMNDSVITMNIASQLIEASRILYNQKYRLSDAAQN